MAKGERNPGVLLRLENSWALSLARSRMLLGYLDPLGCKGGQVSGPARPDPV